MSSPLRPNSGSAADSKSCAKLNGPSASTLVRYSVRYFRLYPRAPRCIAHYSSKRPAFSRQHVRVDSVAALIHTAPYSYSPSNFLLHLFDCFQCQPHLSISRMDSDRDRDVRRLPHTILPCTIPALATDLGSISLVLSVATRRLQEDHHDTHEGGRSVCIAEERDEGGRRMRPVVVRECGAAGHSEGGCQNRA
jgi:hypothetical protein